VDWTMVGNASDTDHRIRTIIYLCRFRYEWDAQSAGESLRREVAADPSCGLVMAELELALAMPEKRFGIGTLISDDDARVYLTELLVAFSASPSPT
jgi:hypothetical protein